MAMIAAPPARIAGTEESGPPFWKKKKERNRSRAHTNAGQRRVIKTFVAKLLVPPAAEPKRGEIKQDRERRCCFDDKPAETVADVIGCEPRENLMSAVENGRR